MAAMEIWVYTQTYVNVSTVIVYTLHLQYVGLHIIKCDLFVQAAELSEEGLGSTLK